MKTLEEIYSELCAEFTGRSGMEVGPDGDLSARLYAVAAQVYGLFLQADWVGRQCFPQTAQGEYLDHHAQMRALERKRAARAQGTVRFFADVSQTPRTIPAGTVCMTAGLVRFETTQDGVLPAGEDHTDLPVQAVQAGLAGNAAAGSVRLLSAPPVGITGCVNPQAMDGGADAEDDESLRQRILESFRRMPNGANAAYYEQEALSMDGVAAAAVLPRNRGQGTVDVVIASEQGVPAQALIDQAAEHFNQRREIAVDVQVLAPETVPVDLVIRIDSARQEAAAQQVEQTLRQWFSGRRLGQDVLRAQLASMVFQTEGVRNCELILPAADVPIGRAQLPVLNSVTVEAMA